MSDLSVLPMGFFIVIAAFFIRDKIEEATREICKAIRERERGDA